LRVPFIEGVLCCEIGSFRTMDSLLSGGNFLQRVCGGGYFLGWVLYGVGVLFVEFILCSVASLKSKGDFLKSVWGVLFGEVSTFWSRGAFCRANTL